MKTLALEDGTEITLDRLRRSVTFRLPTGVNWDELEASLARLEAAAAARELLRQADARARLVPASEFARRRGRPMTDG